MFVKFGKFYFFKRKYKKQETFSWIFTSKDYKQTKGMTAMNNFKKHLRLSLSLILLASLLLSLLSCGKKAYYEDYNFDADYITDSAAPQEPNLNGNSYTSGDYSFSTKSTSYSYESSQKAEDESAGSLAIEAETQRKIIYSSYFSIQTTNFDEASAALDRLCEKYGAYYERSETFGNAESGDRSGSFAIRVPQENYKAFRSEAGNVGTVVHSSENNDDVSEKYFDTEARLSSAKLREERLLDILSKAESLDNVLLLVSELADVRYEIESLSGTLRRYDSLISYSTINIDLNEVIKPAMVQPIPKNFGERISQAVSSGFRDFGNTMEDFAVELSYGLPEFILFVVFVFILVLVVRAIVRKCKKKAGKAPEKPKEDTKPESPKDQNKA